MSVAGVDVSGLSPRAAAVRLTEQITYPQAGKILLRDGDKVWVASPGELGMILDPEASAQAAFNLGRSGPLPERIKTQFDAAYTGLSLPPNLVFDQRSAFRYLSNIAAEIDTPSVDASLSLNGTEVIVTPGQIGRSLDVQASLVLVTLQLESLRDGVLDLYIRESAPFILDASAEADLARKMLSAPLEISLPGGGAGPWTFQPDQLATMLAIQRVDTADGPRYEVGLRQDLLITFLADLAPTLLRYPQNARFIFNDDTHQLEVIQPAVIGRQLNVEASLNQIRDKLRAGEHTVALELITNDPPVTDSMSGEELGITELVQASTSYFRGSSESRRAEHPGCFRQVPRTDGRAGRDLLDGLRHRRHHPGQRLRRSADHHRRADHQRRGRRGLPGEHHPLPQRLLRRIPHRRALRARLPRRLLRADRQRARQQPGRPGRDRLRPDRGLQIRQRYPALAADGNLRRGLQPDLEVLLDRGRPFGGLDHDRGDQHRACPRPDLPREPRPQARRDPPGGLGG